MVAEAGLDAEHAERMDRMYRYQRHIYDLTRKYYLFGRDRMIARLDVPRDGSLLEVGCGTGRNLLLAHRLYPTARLYGLDISAEMLVSARANFRGKPTEPVLAVADATTFTAGEFGVFGFDRVMISYALSMIPDWEKAIDASLAALKPGGSLHVVDFGQQEGLPGWFRRLLQSWLARFHVTPRADLRKALEARLEGIGGRLEFETVGRGYAWHAVIRI
ncbi:methyltransferase domain-containing protein [Rhizobium cremeum]|uniref:class I SAM-dependent methyltransferase n=1 Tax=Rhizobium cremeum TaxID=2813827 RepID=UPI000DD9FDC4|nr:class I SAM-dependent methyltransferase [Rhizobium cremeum]MCJ7993368.1 methyltransferase domain-containing protein [Rhizobium cremeum]MCJ7998433.1 methyltransferase domain-containing protein [Rhizobium cremeum]